MNKIRVLLVDDHPVVRGGIRGLIETDDQIQVVGEAASGHEALEMVVELQPDVVLLDMEMPDLSGVEVARRLQDSRSGARVLALSAYDDPQYIRGLLSSGAAGYLTKDEAPEFILEAINGVWRGQDGWLSRRVAARMSIWTRDDAEQHGLTNRELEVLQTIVDGKTNQEAGLTLGISDKTIEKHLESIYRKLGVSSRVEAAVLAVREGILEQ
jgi:DNA-binding NarL/FixJ family response regulator